MAVDRGIDRGVKTARVATRQIALLRGINVGRAKRVAMADLRALVEGLGYADVRTLLNSGNVVFTAGGAQAKGAAGRIEKAIAGKLGVVARVFVLDAAELAAAMAANPLGAMADDPARMLVAVTGVPADHAKFAALAQRAWAPEALVVGKRVAYLWCADGIIASKLLQAMTRALGDGMTTRNWTTMTKLVALAEGPP